MRWLVTDLAGTQIEAVSGWGILRDRLPADMKGYTFQDVHSGKLPLEEWRQIEREQFRERELTKQKMEQLFQEGVVLKPGSSELLQTARRRGYRVAVFSDEPHEFLLTFYRKANFVPDLEVCYYITYDRDGLYNYGSHPFLENGLGSKSLALQHYISNNNIDRLVVMGDNYNDVKMFQLAKKLKTHSVAIAVDPKDETLRELSDYVIKTPGEAVPLFEKIF